MMLLGVLSNNLVEERRTTANDVVLSIKSSRYNDKGLVVEFIDDDRFHGQYTIMNYSYDDKGNLVEEVCYYGSRRVPQFVIEYDITYRE